MSINPNRQILYSARLYEGPTQQVRNAFPETDQFLRSYFGEPMEGSTPFKKVYDNPNGEGVASIFLIQDQRLGYSALRITMTFNASNPVGPALAAQQVEKLLADAKRKVPKLDRLVEKAA